MTAHMVMAEFLASLDYTGRCPSWAEYENGSPAQKRAISTRWCSIIHQMGAAADAMFYDDALKNYSRKCDLEQSARTNQAAIERMPAQEQFLRGEAVGPDTSDDWGL